MLIGSDIKCYLQVYVILFGVGSSVTEGIYSVRVTTRDEGLPQDTIVAFSAEEDAVRCVSHSLMTFQTPPQLQPELWHACPFV